MTATALILITVAAGFHACWNFLAKRGHNQVLFLWEAGLAGSVLFLPIVIWVTPAGTWPPSVWMGVAAAAALRAGYFASLGAAYGRGDLSLVYPLARGTAVILVPILASLFLGERPAPVGILGVVTVALGVYVLHLPGFTGAALVTPFRALRSPHAGYASLTGLLTATYSVVDKWNIGSGIPPLLYAYLTIPVAALLLTPTVLRDPGALAKEWESNRRTIPAVALLMTSGYLLVLLALRLSPVSYVAAARELGIVFGSLLGSVLLRERYLPQRLTGASLIVLGVFFLAAAPASNPR